MRTHNAGTVHAFCTICGASHCVGHGNGSNIPDHTPDIDSVEEGDSTTITCDICGDRILQSELVLRSIDATGDFAEDFPGDFCYKCIKAYLIPPMKTQADKLTQAIDHIQKYEAGELDN
jgi:hypothetical protein